ncbi:MAG TPA: hypothetical protein VFF21_05180 [Flavobacteriaceae bacterium]|nr:hypothetical protein [Aequorivita sp.]HZW77681.1 hypothetical protein [Flavobacteriaceae bacterium]
MGFKDRVDIFNVEASEGADKLMKAEEYRKHLRKQRNILVFFLLVFAALFFWWGESGRYTLHDKGQLLDTKTGIIYHGKGGV